MGFKDFLKSSLKEKGKAASGGGGGGLLMSRGAAEGELHKHFRVVRLLGRGSFAEVYEVERLTDGRHYALKLTDLHALAHLDKVAVVEEIRLLASLDHPNIIAYFEAFCEGDRLCVVTEIVTGGDLGTHLRRLREADDFLWERQVWGLFLQVALGVQYLHHNHVLHRDLKPANIMLTERSGGGVLKIVDLGVSAELALVFTNTQIGTPHYMAPEMWQRKAFSYSADIWALGCILHELCTLVPTFIDRTEEDVKRRVLAGRYAPIPTRYTFDLSRLIGMMLQQDPKERPTIDEILAMPSVRSKMLHLPAELQPPAAAEATGDRARLEATMQLPEDSRAFNCMLPPAKYPTGRGVAELMCARGQRRSFSLSDLEGAAAAAAAGGPAFGQGSPQRPASPAPGGSGQNSTASQGVGAQGREAAAGEGRPLRSLGSMNDLALGEEEERRLRRRSIMVGELLHCLHQEQAELAAAAAAAAAGSGAGVGRCALGTEAEERRRRSSLQEHGPSLRRRSPQPATPDPAVGATSAHATSAVPAAGSDPGRGARVPDSAAAHVAAGGGAGGGIAAAETEQRGRPPCWASMVRHSVAVAEVLHYQGAKLQRHLERKGSERESITQLSQKLPPLAKQPFEFCAQPSPSPTDRPAGSGPSSSTQHRSALLSQLADGAAGGAGRAVAASVSSRREVQPATGGTGVSTPQQAQQAQHAQQLVSGGEGKKKKKKHGRLWRLMYGDSDSGMHQDVWT